VSRSNPSAVDPLQSFDWRWTSPSTMPLPTVRSARTMGAEYSATVMTSVMVGAMLMVGFRRYGRSRGPQRLRRLHAPRRSGNCAHFWQPFLAAGDA
jgi:hypothetical protein